MSFLDYIIGQGSVQMDPAKVSAVIDWPVPESWKQLQHFLGFANLYQRFIRNSSVVTPLTSLTSVKRLFLWAPDAAFCSLKQWFTAAPILQVPDPSLQFVVEVDASGVGAVLSQRAAADQKLHPCNFFSR